MPIKRRTTRRRRVRKTRTRRPRKTSLVKDIGYLFPQRLRVKLPYTEAALTFSGAATPQEYVFNGNNLFDPNRTGTGHQPLGYDQIKSMYNRYYVSACKIRVELWSASTGTYTGAGNMIIVPNNDSTGLIATYTATNIMEQEHARRKAWANASSKDAKVVATHSMTTRRILSSPGSTSYDAQAQIAAAPVDAWYWHIVLASVDDASLISVAFRVTLVYSCEFFERLPLLSS